MGTVRNPWLIAMTAVAAALMAGVAIVPAASASEGCENEARRVEQSSTFLPDCRAYELVTPPATAPSPVPLKYFAGEPAFGGTETSVPEGTEPVYGSAGVEINTLTPTLRDTAAADDGNAFVLESLEQPGPSLAQCGCVSRRTPEGWVGEDPLPPISPVTVLCLGSAAMDAWSPDIEKTVIAVGGDGERCGHAEPPLAPDEEPGELNSNQQNLFLRDAAGHYQLLDRAPPGVIPKNRLAAISADGSHVLFESNSPLTEDTPPATPYPAGPGKEINNINIYVWDAAQPHSLHLLTVLPNGEATHGPGEGGAYLAGSMNSLEVGRTPEQIYAEANIGEQGMTHSAEANHAISANGERVLFYAGGRTIEGKAQGNYHGGGLYLREHPAAEESAQHECTEAEQAAEPEKACTIRIDVNQGGSGESGNGQFQWANAEATKIFFTDEEELTPGSTAQEGRPDLYEYDLEKPLGQRLTDLTANAPEPADVRGVSGVSEDGSYVYFVAKGDLTGAQQNSHRATALAPAAGTGTLTSGSNEVTGVGTTSGAFRAGMAIGGTGIAPTAWIEAVGDGTLTLSEPASESGTQTLSAEARNLYVRHGGVTTFIAALNPNSSDICDFRMFCLSVRVSQNGQFVAFNSINSLTGYKNDPVDPSACGRGRSEPCIEIFRYAASSGEHGELTCASCHPDGSRPAAEFAYADIERPQIEKIASGTRAIPINQNVSDSGQVFFSTMEGLVEADENNTWDVYEYEGGEKSSAELHLISSGKSSEPSYFVAVTPDGSNVFFYTTESLLRADNRADYDAYDARVNGGFRSQNEAPQPVPCESEGECLPPLTEPPATFSAGSAALFGAGNLAIAPEQSGVKETARCKKGFVRSRGKCVRVRHGKRGKHRRRRGHRRRAAHGHRRAGK